MWKEISTTLGGRSSTVNVYKQSQNESCGPSSLLMLIRQREGILSSEAMMRLWISQAERALQAAGESVSGTHAATDARIFDMEGGARGLALHRAIATKKASYRATYHSNDLENLVSSCSATTPGILRVAWTGSTAAHFVVCLGTSGVSGPATRGGSGPAARAFLDPWYGLVQNNVHIFPQYDTTSGTFGAGVGKGTFTHLILTK